MKATRLEISTRALQILAALEGGKDLKNMPREDLVDVGQRLWWLVKKADGVLTEIKEILREEALSLSPQEMTRFDSPSGAHCLVIPSKSSVALKKNIDVDALKATLGPTFSSFFETLVTYRVRKEFQPLVASAPPAIQNAVLSSITMEDRTPRVVFKD